METKFPTDVADKTSPEEGSFRAYCVLICFEVLPLMWFGSPVPLSVGQNVVLSFDRISHCGTVVICKDSPSWVLRDCPPFLRSSQRGVLTSQPPRYVAGEVTRIATSDDIRSLQRLVARNQHALSAARSAASAASIPVDVLATYFSLDSSRLFVFYSAAADVAHRVLAKPLQRVFGVRVWISRVPGRESLAPLGVSDDGMAATTEQWLGCLYPQLINGNISTGMPMPASISAAAGVADPIGDHGPDPSRAPSGGAAPGGGLVFSSSISQPVATVGQLQHQMGLLVGQQHHVPVPPPPAAAPTSEPLVPMLLHSSHWSSPAPQPRATTTSQPWLDAPQGVPPPQAAYGAPMHAQLQSMGSAAQGGSSRGAPLAPSPGGTGGAYGVPVPAQTVSPPLLSPFVQPLPADDGTHVPDQASVDGVADAMRAVAQQSLIQLLTNGAAGAGGAGGADALDAGAIVALLAALQPASGISGSGAGGAGGAPLPTGVSTGLSQQSLPAPHGLSQGPLGAHAHGLSGLPLGGVVAYGSHQPAPSSQVSQHQLPPVARGPCAQQGMGGGPPPSPGLSGGPPMPSLGLGGGLMPPLAHVGGPGDDFLGALPQPADAQQGFGAWLDSPGGAPMEPHRAVSGSARGGRMSGGEWTSGRSGGWGNPMQQPGGAGASTWGGPAPLRPDSSGTMGPPGSGRAGRGRGAASAGSNGGRGGRGGGWDDSHRVVVGGDVRRERYDQQQQQRWTQRLQRRQILWAQMQGIPGQQQQQQQQQQPGGAPSYVPGGRNGSTQ